MRIRHSKRYILEVPNNKGNDIVGIGDNIAYWRKRRGMTLEVLAIKSGISKGYLASIEKGKVPPQIKTVSIIAESLRMGLEAMLKDNSEE